MHGGSWDFNNMVDMMVDGDCLAGALVLRPTSNQGLLRTNEGVRPFPPRAHVSN